MSYHMLSLKDYAAIATVCLCAGAAWFPRAQHDPVAAVAVLQKHIANPAALVLARCEALAALRGGYRLVLRVSADAAAGGQARRIRVDAGRLSVGPDSAPLASGLAKVEEKAGRVHAETKEEAFARGLAFFLTDVKLHGPDSVTFVVHSNPSISLDVVFVRIEKNFDGFTGETVETRSPLGSSAGPLVRNFTISPALREDVQAHLGIISLEDGEVRCLQSNEVRLASR